MSDIIHMVIPTYKRATERQQHTLRNIPEYLRPHTSLVVRQDQVEDYQPIADKFGCKLMKLPEGSSGIAQARKQIAEALEGTRYWVLDDDLQFRCVEWEENPENGKPYTESIPATEAQMRRAITEINAFMDLGFTFGSCHVSNIPPNEKGYDVCSRIWTNVFYSEKLPVYNLDWGDAHEMMPEDFHVALQLYIMGHPSIIFHKMRVSPVGSTNADGGCAEYRNIENHNAGQQLLADLYPDFVKVYEKVQTAGAWKGIPKKALRVRWKDAFKSSGVELPKLPEWAVGRV
jgi:hypothetical protein